MPAEYPRGRGPVVRGVGLMQLIVRLGGENQGIMYDIAYLDGGGQSMGRVRSNVLKSRSLDLLDQLIHQIEKDFVDVSGTELHSEESLANPMDDDDDGLNYPSP